MCILFSSAPSTTPSQNPSTSPTIDLMPSNSPTETCHDSSNVNGLGIDCESYLAMFTVGAEVICVISKDYAEQCCKLCEVYLMMTDSPTQGTKRVWAKCVENIFN